MRGGVYCLIAAAWLVAAPGATGKSRTQFNGVDTQGVELACECFKIILNDIQIADGPGIFAKSEVLKLVLANPGATTCELDPYQFRLVTPAGDQREVLFAVDEQELTTLRFTTLEHVPKASVSLAARATKKYWITFGDFTLDKAKPTKFYYKDKLLGSFTYR